jgi:NAD(P)-dependent dehydrogenase (short-subunit alcohol dehydrogenase family)
MTASSLQEGETVPDPDIAGSSDLPGERLSSKPNCPYTYSPRLKALADVPVLDLFSLAGKAIIVTGGARGLGLCIAQSLLEASAAHIYCCDVLPQPHAEEWAQAKQVAQRYGGEIEYCQVDITDAGMVDEVVGRIYERSGEEVCGLFAAAGIQQMTAALDYTPEDFRRIMDVNVTGTVLPILCQSPSGN